jgi:vacuolar-type H+-ATPase subunit H
MSYDLAVLEQQIWRMENPHQLAQERLGKVGHGLLTYATALEDAVEKAGVQLGELRSGFDAEIAEFEQVAESVRARAVDSGETLRAQAEELSATAARIAANLEQIRGTGKDEALAIDGASERATASLRELIEAMRGQIESLEENFQQAVENTVGRVSGAGNAASEDIRSAADLVVSRTQDVVDSVRQETEAARAALGEAGEKITKDVSLASDAALSNARTIGEELGRHANQIGIGFEEAARTADEVRGAYLDSNRGVLLHTVNRVLDTLGSLGIDLNRVLEGDVAPEIIKRFNRGDRTAAVRRIASRVGEPALIARVRELFEEDEEFRALATRYLREFERLLTQAGDADPDELLSASLLTADVGKAYLLLSRAIDRHK